jgi:C-terminal binding-module, SLH-like, of glucodextranase
VPRRSLVGFAVAGVLAGLAVAPAAASATSFYGGTPPRPGPDILYEPPATAPQLTNSGVWHAQPILVSGASAYRNGEFLYQDFLYDDHGAHERPDPNDPRAAIDTFSKPNGTYTYPTDSAYANNAADLVELRVQPLEQSTAFRLTLNTLKDPSLVAFTIALGGSGGTTHPLPFGANVQAPANRFVTVHPGARALVGTITDATTRASLGTTPSPTVDMDRRQIEVRVPHAVWNPSGRTVRLAAGVGLWDKANNRYLTPQPAADATHPGGSGDAAKPPAFFNVAFRFDEPMPQVGDPDGTARSPAWWRDKAQGEKLATGDVSPFHAKVDFTKLAASTTDNATVPATGPMDRILASHFETAQGADYSSPCFPADTATCTGEYQGRLQPYAIYVPKQPQPAGGYGMTLLLHSLSATYNQYLDSRHQSQFGERGPGSIVITPLARGPDGFYESYAAADVFEVWADVARRYQLDSAWTVIAGYSMGGYGTFRLGEQFPDLFARAQPTVGASNDNNMVASLRNVPVLMWNASSDELVPQSSYLPTAQALDSNGYRYELDVFTAEHLTLAINDQYAPAAAFLGTAKVQRNPRHITYVVEPNLDHPELGVVGDHAYWIGDAKTRGAGQGEVDAFSHAFGLGDPPASATQFGSGTLSGGNLGTLAFSRQYKTWGSARSIPTKDRIDLEATNISELTISPTRAHVDCDVDLQVTSDGPLTIHLAGCNRTVQVP